jgi:histidine triad (HIT) family protein
MKVAVAYADPIGQYNFITSAGKAATQSVMHLHIHIVPRQEGDGLLLPWSGQQPLMTASAMKTCVHTSGECACP